MFFSPQEIALIIVALISGVLSPITVQLFQNYLKHKNAKKKHDLARNSLLKNDELIIRKLESIKEKYNADRVWLAEFHNGEHTYSGKNFQKFSITYEVVNTGVSSEAPNTQALPASIFSIFLKKLNTENFLMVKNTEEEQDVLNLKNFYISRGVKSFASLAIKDIENNFVGILCLDGVYKHLEFDENKIERLIFETSSIAGYLET
jgi:hypothetical protein